MKKVLSKIHKVIKASLPYTALVAVILGVINIVLINKVQSDIEYTYSRVDDVESAIQSINTDYDNSDIISNVRQAHNSIVRHIEEAENDIERTIRLWN